MYFSFNGNNYILWIKDGYIMMHNSETLEIESVATKAESLVKQYVRIPNSCFIFDDIDLITGKTMQDMLLEIGIVYDSGFFAHIGEPYNINEKIFMINVLASQVTDMYMKLNHNCL